MTSTQTFYTTITFNPRVLKNIVSKIYKYRLDFSAITSITVPKGSFPVKAAFVGNDLFVWIQLYALENKTVNLVFEVAGTGWDIADKYFHLDTVFEGPYVWHIMYAEEGC